VLGADILPPLLVTFGLSVVIQNGLLSGFTADSRKLTAGAIETPRWTWVSVTVGVMPLLTFASAVAVVLALNQLFYRTALGRAFRATSDDPVTAQLMGIRPQRIFAMATGIALVVVTIAALYLGTRANFDPSIGPARLLYAFEAVIIGGLGSLWGTLAGGIVIGWRRRWAPPSTPSGRSCGPHRLCPCPADPAARPVPAGERLRCRR
jgi:branched-chain amino acid transport system permease protein